MRQIEPMPARGIGVNAKFSTRTAHAAAETSRTVTSVAADRKDENRCSAGYTWVFRSSLTV